MALVICPECGKEISDSCDKCIHCGCSVVKCLECGNVNLKESVVCSHCGKNLQEDCKKEVKESNPEEKIDLQGKDSFTVWQNLNPEIKSKRKTLRILNNVVYIVPSLLLVVFFILCSQQIRELGISGLETIRNYVIFGSICAGLVLFFISFFSDIREYYTIREFSLWCDKNNIDTTNDLIKSELEVEAFHIDSNQAFECAIYYKKDKNFINKKKTEWIISIIGSLICAIIVALIVRDNFLTISSMVAGTIEFNFGYFHWDTLKIVLLVVVIIVRFIVEIVIDPASKYKQWKKELISKAKEEKNKEKI